MVQQILSTNTFTTAKWIVSATASDGTHTTIGAALISASSGDTIFIRPGTYTENPALKAGVNLAAYDCDAETPNVIINGKCTFSSAGTVSLSGICLQTNSDYCLAITGSAASIVNLDNCYINALNNPAIDYTSSSSSSQLNIFNTNGNLGTTGIGLFTMSSTGTFRHQFSLILNSGASTTANTVSAGNYYPAEVSLQNPITISSTGTISAGRSTFNCGAINTTAVTINTSGAASFQSCNFTGGTASAITVTSGTMTVDVANVSSSNTNAITGAGTIQYGLITYTGSSSTNNVTTQTPFTTQPVISSSTGAWTLLHTATASSSATISFSSTYLTSTYKNYAVVFSNIVPATNGVSFNMTVSTNNGSSYLNTGYNANAGVCSSAGGSINSTNSTTAIPFNYSGNPLKNTAGEGLSGVLYLTNWTTGSNYPQVSGSGQYLESSAGVIVLALWGGNAPTSSTINNIQFAMSSGNISSGTFSLYGISS